MSLINKEVSDFTAKAYHDNGFITVTKEDLLGKWSVFFFYPADFTFVCPTELADLESFYEEFKKIGCEIYSVSCDTEFVHKAWHDHSPLIKDITYPMLADPTHALARDLKSSSKTPASLNGEPSSSIRKARLSLMKSMPAM